MCRYQGFRWSVAWASSGFPLFDELLKKQNRLFQLVVAGLPTAFPPLRTLDSQPNNLPIEPTPFIGREREVSTLCRLLTRPEVRLLTLTGPGASVKRAWRCKRLPRLATGMPTGYLWYLWLP